MSQAAQAAKAPAGSAAQQAQGASQEQKEQVKTPVQENRKLAVRILAVAIIISLFLIAPLKLNAYHNRVERVFKNGVTTEYVSSVDAFINSSIASAEDLQAAAEATYGATEDTAKLAEAIKNLRASKDPNQRVALYEEMYQYAIRVFNAYKAQYEAAGQTLSKGDKVYKDKDNLDSDRIQINNNGYWSQAEKYNKARGGFPASLIGGLFGIDYLPER